MYSQPSLLTIRPTHNKPDSQPAACSLLGLLEDGPSHLLERDLLSLETISSTTHYDNRALSSNLSPQFPFVSPTLVFLSFVKHRCVSVTTLYTCVDVLVWVGVCSVVGLCVCV